MGALWVPMMLAASLLATACSALRIGYSQAPDIVYWWVDSYIDFEGDQTPKVREAINQWFDWHRRTQLPEYAERLAAGEKEVLLDTTPARVCEWQRELFTRMRTAVDQALPPAAELVTTITPQQVQYLDKRYRKNNQEFRDEYLQADPKKRLEANLKRTLNRAESIYGRFDDNQRARIAELLEKSPFDPDQWLAERVERQQDALRILRTVSADGATKEQAVAALKGYADRIQRSPRESYRRYSDRLTEFNCGFGAAVHNLTTAEQRRTAARKLAGWEGDLRALVALGNNGTVKP